MAKYLAIFSDTIDEIGINGFITMTDKEVEQYEELASSITWYFTYNVGDNFELEFSSGDDLLGRLEFKEISNDEFKVFKKLFDGKFGIFISEDDLHNIIGEEESEIDDDDEDDDFIYDNDTEDDDY